MIYLNEIEPFAVDWLNCLSVSGQIHNSYVDSRSIHDVDGSDIKGFDQCHFFAGIGGWPLAFELAGIRPDVNAWSGSCPCQPFSTAGKQKGVNDERHLWPDMFRLIRECRPEYVFGEQVSAAIRLGWIDGVQADLEGAGYAFGYTVLGAHSVGSPHIRQRIFWGAKRVSDADLSRKATEAIGLARDGRPNGDASGGCRADIHGLSDATSPRHAGAGQGASDRQRASADAQRRLGDPESAGTGERLLNANGNGRKSREPAAETARYRDSADATGGGLCHSINSGLQGHAGNVVDGYESGRFDTDSGRSIAASDAWSDYTIGHFRDGKARRIGRGVQPLAHGVPKGMGRGESGLLRLLRRASKNRTGRLKGYGNAIVPQVAAVFIRAFMESINDG